MLKLLKKIITFSFALLVVLSTTSFSTHFHFCQDQLMKIGFFSQPETCHSSNDQKAQCPMHNHKKGCCDNESLDVKGSQTAQVFAAPICPQPKLVDMAALWGVDITPSFLYAEPIKRLNYNKLEKPPNWRYFPNNYSVVFQHFII